MTNLFIFGSTGDLVKRKIFPALQYLPKINVYALGRQPLDTKNYLDSFCTKCPPSLAKNTNYIHLDFSSNYLSQLTNYLSTKSTNYFYLALHPNLFPDILKQLATLKSYKIKILLEKPFGTDLTSAQKLKSLVSKLKLTDHTYLSDHYLFKPNILKLNRKKFNNLKIVSLESVGLEGRNYYDSVGALKDIVQNHFFNILFKLTKIDLSSIKITKFIRGQYNSYTKDLGSTSSTETYVYLSLTHKNQNITLITGKGFKNKISYLKIDDKKISLLEKTNQDNPYISIFTNFFKQNTQNFPTIDNSILAWKIIKKITSLKSPLQIYPYQSISLNPFSLK